MLLRQLFDRDSCTYTYLVADERTGEAALVDPVRELVDRDVALLEELGLTLKYTLETHVHADHVTSSGLLRQRLGSRAVLSARAGAPCVDVAVSDGDTLRLGDLTIEARATPGHTDGCTSYHLPDHGLVFTGDALLVRGCGRTDFQQGDAATLYRSIHDRLFTLPDATRVLPGHDYKGRTETTIGEEKAHNPRLGGGRSLAQFVAIMDGLDLQPPRQIEVAVPANQRCGLELVEAPAAADPAPVAAPAPWAPVVRDGDGVPEVDVHWVAGRAAASDRAGRPRLVDVRAPAEFTDDLGHVAGAQLYPLDDLVAHAHAWDRSEPLVLICRAGGRSGSAAFLLERMGFERVASMRGGMLQWTQAGLPVRREAAMRVA